MRLFDFQEQAVANVLQFVKSGLEFKKNLPKNYANIDPYELAFRDNGKPVYNSLKSRSGLFVPNVCLSIPSGGGKTPIGLTCVLKLKEKYFSNTNLCVWLVPNNAIYSQFLLRLKEEDYYSGLDSLQGKILNVNTLGSKLTMQDVLSDDVTILLLTYQSIIRDKNKQEKLNIFKPHNDLAFLTSLPNFNGPVPSLFEFIKYSHPLVVVDEAHRIYTELGRTFLTDLNPEMVLELTATPKASKSDRDGMEPNIIFQASGNDLVNNQLIKQPISFNSYQSFDIKELLQEVVKLQKKLERTSKAEEAQLIPKVLVSVEFTDKRFKDKNGSIYSVKDALIKLGVSPDSIKIKSSTVDEIDQIDLDSPVVEVRYLLTKRALLEGWDCKSVYIVVLINRIGAEVTNFQLAGRGMRQPYQHYFVKPQLNTLYILTNSSKHTESINKLKSVLEKKGLSSLGVSDTGGGPEEKHKPVYFKLIKKKYASDIPRIRVKNKKALELILYQNQLKSISKLACVPRSVSYDSIDDKGRKSSVINIGCTVQDTWSFVPYITQEKVDAKTLALHFCRSIHTFFPNSFLAFNFAQRQIKIWCKEGVPLVEIAAKKDVLANVLSDYINEKKRQSIQSSFLECVKKGLLNVELGGSRSSSLPGEIVYCVHPNDKYETRFKKNIYGNIPKDQFNSDELDFAYFIEDLNVKGWMRNEKHNTNVCYDCITRKVYPDFIIFGEGHPNTLAIIIETKGAHLNDSTDTKGKKDFFDALNKAADEKSKFIIGTFDYCKGKLKKEFGDS
jgi:type III restriction enzyme